MMTGRMMITITACSRASLRSAWHRSSAGATLLFSHTPCVSYTLHTYPILCTYILYFAHISTLCVSFTLYIYICTLCVSYTLHISTLCVIYVAHISTPSKPCVVNLAHICTPYSYAVCLMPLNTHTLLQNCTHTHGIN